MRNRLAVFAALAFAGLVPFGGAAQAARPAALSVAQCSSSYTHASIGGASKCLRRGEYCAVRYKTTYRHYGFTCSGSPARLH
ncbi:MAG: hypothetical protein QOI02_290 [Actinomycetota bacterium]|nr:hypothetical protein [Actinomycetota bacterium]